MDADAVSSYRLGLVREAAKNIWSKYKNPADLVDRLFASRLNYHNADGSDTDAGPVMDGFELIYDFVRLKEEGSIETLLWGSGSFTTGEQELAEEMLMKEYRGKPVVNYVGVVTNKMKSRAKDVADRFGKKFVGIDFGEWCRENYPEIEKPITDTSFFFPPGSEGRPSESELKFRYGVRKEFEVTLLDKTTDTLGYIPQSHSLRGYSFPIMHQNGQFDDTHPADMSYVSQDGVPLYPGWQSGATQKMVDDGHKVFRSSLIDVIPVDDFSKIDVVDAGALLMLGGGYQPDRPMTAEEIQSAMKKTEDYVLCATKAWGLFPTFWSMSRDKIGVYYRRLDGEAVKVNQKVLRVGLSLKLGTNAFGQDLERDLNLLTHELEG